MTRSDEVLAAVTVIADEFAAQRVQRQARTSLDRSDFDRLAAAGLLATGLPAERGGLWESLAASTRAICELFRTLARGDPSVALVASMHPAVLAFWLATPEVPEPHAAAWTRQRNLWFDRVEAGSWFGTVTSEPGSGGDVRRSRAVARRSRTHGADDQHEIHGQKHFASGMGMSSYMLTTAIPEGEAEPDWFVVPTGDIPLDGSAGVRLVAAWDGHGMRATQSHALEFTGREATRIAWPGHLQHVIDGAAPFFGLLFTAVVVGVTEAAVDAARTQLAGRRADLRPFERVDWTQAELEAWTMIQAYEGALRALETGTGARGASMRAKMIGAQLAESCLTRLCRVLGGGTFSQRSPVGNAFEDVRALGFLRPPWALAYDGLAEESLGG